MHPDSPAAKMMTINVYLIAPSDLVIGEFENPHLSGIAVAFRLSP
jgi:hypothetical protein